MIAVLGLALGCGPGTEKEGNESTLSASEILAKVEGVYKTCESYSDSGLVETVLKSEGPILEYEKPFLTAFVRPNRFRFEYKSKFPIPGMKEHRHIIWAEGEDVRSWWDIQPGVDKKASLGMALAEATGVSGGSAHTIPELLMADKVGGSRITRLRESKLLEDATQDDMPCFRVQGKHPGGDHTCVLWISKDSFLIHRIDKAGNLPKTADHEAMTTQETTIYKPQINIKIKKGELDFNAPESE